MHLEFLVEEASAERALSILIPKIVGDRVYFRIHSFQGKNHLLKRLPNRLRGYRAWIPDDWAVVVLIDNDRGDCHSLKYQLNQIANNAGFSTVPIFNQKRILNRIAVEELEAWFFGDFNAVIDAYPRVPNISGRAKYRNPDGIDRTWESLERVLQKAGYYQGGMPKIKVAEDIALHMEPDSNTSHSFGIFRDGIKRLLKSI